MSFLKSLFSFEGRISRKTYWISMAAVLLAPFLVWLVFAALIRGGMIPPSEAVKTVFFGLLLLPPLVPLMALFIKRLHDRGRSWRTLAALVLSVVAIIIAERLFFYLHEGEPIIPAKQTTLAVMLFLLASAPITSLHFLAPVGTYMFLSNVAKIIASVQGGYWDIPTAFYFADSLAGLILLVAGLWYLREVGFRRGTVGPNTYGPDPLQE